MRELSLNIMDVVQNSITAKSMLTEIALIEDSNINELLIRISDNGCGMSEDQLEKVQSPFFSTRTTRKIGLGVPFFKMACEMTGGSFSIKSKIDVGTEVNAIFKTNHIDMTPIGDINETILLLITCNPDLDFIYTRSLNEKSFTLDTREIREVLGDVSFGSSDVVLWLKDFLKENQDEILT